MSELNIIEIEHGISYITPLESPLSSNVVVIEESDDIWLYDVGNHPDVIELLQEINCDSKNMNIVLSHFHPDHIGNLDRICGLCQNGAAQDKGHPQIKDRIKIYQGKYTYKHTNKGEIVSDDMYIDAGFHKFHIFQLPSCHSKGSVAMEVDGRYCFLGDALYPATKGPVREYNKSLLKEEINTLEKIKAPYFMLSHKEPFARPKNVVMAWIEKIYKGL